MFNNQKILISGGTGMIGRSLIRQLKKYNPSSITSVSMDTSQIDGVECLQLDLTDINLCNEVCEGKDYIFHLAGIKGSPDMAAKKPASFSVPMLQFNTNMIQAAANYAKWFLYTSSIGVYQPAPLLKEDDVWKTFPSPNDKFAGWSKRIGELTIEAYGIELGLKNMSIVRPANVYGQYDNFNPESCMVVPALINRIFSGENPLKVWGNGEQIRDLIHADDVARGMIHAVENKITEPINLGSGNGVLIRELVELVVEYYHRMTGKQVSILYDASKPSGDPIRLMDMTRAKSYGFKCDVPLDIGVWNTMNWYNQNKHLLKFRYEPFKV